MVRAVVLALAGLLLGAGACGGDPAEAPAPPVVELACEPGEVLGADGASCRAAGIEPTTCAAGFVPDDTGGCTPTLPSEPCGRGTLATPGETTCRPVAPCGEGPWGDVPVEPDTVFVDATAVGAEGDGSAERPVATIGAAVTAAPPGAIVAIAAGRYVEDVTVAGKPLQLWGRCPELVELQGTEAGTAALFVGGGAAGTVVRALSVTGPKYGIAASGSEDVRLVAVWVHDTGSRGVLVESSLGPSSLTVEGVLVEAVADVGVMSYGAPLVVEASVVRDVSVGAGFGRGIVARHGATLALGRSLVERSRDHGLVVAGAQADIDASVVRDTAADAVGEFGGGLVARRDSDTDEPAAVAIRGSSFAGHRTYGLLVEGSALDLERTVVRDTSPQEADGQLGVGIQAQPSTEPASLHVRDAVVERSHYGGIAIMGSSAVVESTIVRDTRPRPAEQDFGRGLLVFYDELAGLGAAATIRGSAIERNVEAGLFAAAAELVVEATVVRDTAPRPADGRIGRGVSIQSQDALFWPSHARITHSLVERSHEIGLLVEGSTVELAHSVVRGTTAQAREGILGDNVTAVSMLLPSDQAALVIRACRIEGGMRAGVANFGGQVQLADSTLDCNTIDLNAQDSAVAAFSFEDGGGNRCGCGGDAGSCQLATETLVPPEPLP